MQQIERPLDKAILKPQEAVRKFDLKQYAPSAALSRWIEKFWTLSYDLTGEAPYSQTVLSYPSVNLTLECEDGTWSAGVYGVPRSTFTRTLTGCGECFSVKFKPGGFYPFWRQPASSLTGRTVGFGELFGPAGEALARRLPEACEPGERLGIMERFLLELCPERDETAELAAQIVADAAGDRGMVCVEDMANRHGLSVRSLQRLLDRYIGVSPKWILQRFRLQEAAERIRQGGAADWSALAADLGYYDQAHFIRDFKSVVGQTPDAYARASEAGK